MNNSRLITKRRLSYSTSLSSSSSSNDSDASMSSVDTEGLLEEQDVPLPHAILNEGDDDKDERSFYRIPKTKGRPKKKLVLEQQQTTISMPKKKRGRPRKNWNEAMETKGDALKNSLSPEREPESSMEENNEHAKNTKRLKMTYNQNKEFKNDLPKSSSSNESSDDSDNESKPKSPTETLRDPESVGVSGSVKDSDTRIENEDENDHDHDRDHDHNDNDVKSNSNSKSISNSDSDSDRERNSNSDSDSDSNSDGDSDGSIADFESESDDEAPRRKKKSPKVRRKPAMDKTFTEVSLDNIIRRRDIVARNPEAYKNKKFITRSSRRLDYKESSSDECLDDSNNERKDTHKKNVNKKPQRRGTKQINETKKQNQQREANTRRRRRNNSKENTAALPIINENYKLSLLIENRVTALTDDEPTEPWCCDFEPHRTGQVQTDIAALAGSNTVFFLDARQGRYIKKYTHPETQEAFQCLAWTTLHIDHESDSSSDEDEETCNVLAIAGKLGSIKLLNPLQNECYRYLFGHRDVVLKMVFSEFEPRWLFSTSMDKTVRLWDIGSPISATDDTICLAKFILPSDTNEPSALNISYDLSTIVVGCSDGNLVRFELDNEQIKNFKEIVINSKDEDPITIHPAAVYPAGDEWHEGHIDDIHILGQDGDQKSPLYNHVISRGAEDMEIVVWDPKKSTLDDIEIYKSFDWPESFDIKGSRFKVMEKNGLKVLIAGDYEGNIHIFDIDNVRSKTLSDNSKEVMNPTRILSHETSNAVIRDISLSSDTRCIVAIDINNNTFVWTCTTAN